MITAMMAARRCIKYLELCGTHGRVIPAQCDEKLVLLHAIEIV